MKTTIQALKLFLIMTIITGIAYPLLITILGQALFPEKANGSLIRVNDRYIGSELIGQKFTSDKYFWPRPSVVDYNPLPSGGSNLGPTSAALRDSVAARRGTLEHANFGSSQIPIDLLFASGSGLDPDITPEAARFQINRIAKSRALDNEAKKKLINLVETYIEPPDFKVLGEPRVNVLRLNLAVDSTFEGQKP